MLILTLESDLAGAAKGLKPYVDCFQFAVHVIASIAFFPLVPKLS